MDNKSYPNRETSHNKNLIVWRRTDRTIHRENGPATIWEDGSIGWWWNDWPYPFNEWIKLVNLPDELAVELKLKYG